MEARGERKHLNRGVLLLHFLLLEENGPIPSSLLSSKLRQEGIESLIACNSEPFLGISYIYVSESQQRMSLNRRTEEELEEILEEEKMGRKKERRRYYSSFYPIIGGFAFSFPLNVSNLYR